MKIVIMDIEFSSDIKDYGPFWCLYSVIFINV